MPEPCSWQVYVKERMRRVNQFSSPLNYGRKILIPNIVIPPLQIWKKNSQKNFPTQKIPTNVFETYWQGRLWLFSVGCFKTYSGFLAGIFSGISMAPKEQSYSSPINIYQNGLQNWYTFRKQIDFSFWANLKIGLISKIIWAEFQNSVRICLLSESGFWSQFVFCPNSFLVRIAVKLWKEL